MELEEELELARMNKCHICGRPLGAQTGTVLLEFSGIDFVLDHQRAEAIIEPLEKKPHCWECFSLLVSLLYAFQRAGALGGYGLAKALVEKSREFYQQEKSRRTGQQG